ncbi:MAG: S-layer homology domain-containing protein [Oscillospiraceae bacterium]|nr:S-layer homology domain-containing protein [Oscillospiraceae bacterium]
MKSALKIVCAAVIALALSIQAFASFSDVPENAWYAQPVEMLSEMGTIDGYGDGTFGPDDTLEAAQLLKILGMTFYPEEIAPQGEDESWGARFYAAALDHGVVTEELVSADEMYDKISRYKVAAIISAVMINIMGEDIAVPDEVSARIGDFDAIPEEYVAAVKTVYSAGVIGGCDEKGSYKGDLELTRAQAATIVMRMLLTEERLIDGKSPHQPEPEPEPEQPVLTPLDDEWFANTMFLGDSLTCGLGGYSDLKTPTYFYYDGCGCWNIRSKTLKCLNDGVSRTFNAALTSRNWERVIILLGINELGFSTETYIANYSALIDAIRAVRPDIEICIQSILPVTKQKSAEGFSIYTIQTKNAALAQLARDKNCMFVNVYECLADAEGYLPLTYKGWDGVHLNTSGYNRWADYLRNHLGG